MIKGGLSVRRLKGIASGNTTTVRKSDSRKQLMNEVCGPVFWLFSNWNWKILQNEITGTETSFSISFGLVVN